MRKNGNIHQRAKETHYVTVYVDANEFDNEAAASKHAEKMLEDLDGCICKVKVQKRTLSFADFNASDKEFRYMAEFTLDLLQ